MISVQEILGRLDAVKKTGPGQWMGRCPAHEDRIPSLSVKDGEKILLKCFADCEFSDIVQALGLKESDLFPDNGTNGKGSKPEIIAAYEYRNEDDEPVGRVVRLPGKNFRQQHRCPEAPDGWTWGLGGDPKRCECPKVQLPLYRLSRVIEGVALGKTIHVVEGEKDVQAIEKAGGVATCNPGGAGNWRDEYSENLRGARVVVVADNDEKGKEHAQAVAMSLEGIAASVKIVLAREGKDAADHIAAGHGLDDFVPLDQEERKLPAPMGINDLMQVAEPEEHWLVEGHVPAGGNVLVAGYPKTFKTFFLLELSVALASQTPFLGKFDVPERRRVGLVLMEDQAHRVRRRLNRLCEGRRIDLSELDGWLHFWFRPPLRLNDQTVRELGDYAAELELDFLGIDSWSYVASGDSNSADEVTPQLQDLSLARTKREGLTVELTHHARKEREDKKTGTRLTDRDQKLGRLWRVVRCSARSLAAGRNLARHGPHRAAGLPPLPTRSRSRSRTRTRLGQRTTTARAAGCDAR